MLYLILTRNDFNLLFSSYSQQLNVGQFQFILKILRTISRKLGIMIKLKIFIFIYISKNMILYYLI